jgi:hypothetical protein
MSGVRDIDAAGVAIDVDIVPTFIAGNGNGFDDVVARGTGLGSGAGKCSSGKNSGGRECSEAEGNELFAHSFLFSFCFVVSNDVSCIQLGR